MFFNGKLIVNFKKSIRVEINIDNYFLKRNQYLQINIVLDKYFMSEKYLVKKKGVNEVSSGKNKVDDNCS